MTRTSMQLIKFNIGCSSHTQKYGMTALTWATYKGHEQVIDVLLKAGANPNIPDSVCCGSHYTCILIIIIQLVVII